jgi:ubiquinone/menaquinone biosynthesis C-methylase UbiE
MKRVTALTVTLIAALVGAGLWWRYAARRRQLPCPSWLAWLLENPFTDSVAGTQTTLDRIGLRPGERGLDVGSGPGRLSLPAARRVGPTGHIVALDIQPEMLARLRRRADQAGLTNLVAQQGDIADRNSLPSEDFDRAWLVTVLGEIPDQAAALRNLYRVLKPGGTLSITEIFPDPHYQSRTTVLRLGREAGFVPTQYWGTPLAFTQNFVKPSAMR